MRKLFTLAAVCCMMFVSSVQAQGLADGAKIQFGTKVVDESNKADVFSDGKVSYNTTDHTLTLNNWSKFSDTYQLVVDASGLNEDKDFIIEIVGSCELSTQSVAPFYLKKGKGDHGFVIEGKGGAELELYVNGSAYNSALACFNDYSDTKYVPLTIRGGLYVEAHNLNTKTPSYPAIVCEGLTIDNADVYAITNNNYDLHGAVVAGNAPITVTNAQILPKTMVSTSSVGQYFVVRKNGEEMYPVIVDGFQLNSHTPSLSNTESNRIYGGIISYDPKTRTVLMSNGFEFGSYYKSADAAIVIKDEVNPTQPVHITTDGTTIQITGMNGRKGIVIESPAEFDLNGSNITVVGKLDYGMELKSSLKVFSSYKRGTLSVSSPKKCGITGSGENAKLTIDGVSVNAQGGNDNLSFAGFAYEPIDVEFISGAAGGWDETKKSAVDGSGNEVKDALVKIGFNKGEVVAKSIPEGAGEFSLTATNVEGTQAVPYRYAYTSDFDYTITAKAKANYKFHRWEYDGSAYWDADQTKSVTSQTDYYWTAYFQRLISSNRAFYSVEYNTSETKYQVMKYAENDKLLSAPTEVCEIDPSTYTLDGAVFAAGKIYYIAGNSGTQHGILTMEFDGTSAGAAGSFVPVSATYEYMSEIAYSENDAAIYAIYNDGTNNKLAKFPLDNPSTPTEVELPLIVKYITYPVGMAFDNSGTLYVLGLGGDLYTVNPATGAETFLGYLGGTSTSWNDGTMYFDPESNELIARLDDGLGNYIVYLINPTTLDYEWVSTRDNGEPRGLFNILPTYPITIKSNDETLGTVSPSGTVNLSQGKKLTIMATPTEFGIFKSWSDGGAQSHEITVGAEAKTYTATFEADPENTPYPIWVNGKQITSKTTTIVGPNATYGITAGAITYDATSNTITLNSVTMDAGSITAIEVKGTASQKVPAANVAIKGTCTLKGGAGLVLEHAAGVTVTGDASAALTITASVGVVLEDAKLTFKGITATITGGASGIRGNDDACSLEIIGSNLKVTGTASGSIVDIKTYKEKYCKITSPSGAAYDSEKKAVANGGTVVKAQVVYKSDPVLSLEGWEDGTCTFTMSAEGSETFKDGKGWFESGKEVTITCKPSSGYVFGRWKDDDNWNDPDNKMSATRTYTTTSSDKTLTALCYYKVKSTATWYCVNSNEFSSFRMTDQALKANRASSPSGNSVLAGDYVGSQWYYLTGTTIKSFAFKGPINDGEDIKMSGSDPVDIATGVPSSATDMAYDLKAGRTYVVAGKELYVVNVGDSKLDKIGVFKYKGSEISVVCIAIDANGVKYVLTPSLSAGQLFKFENKDIKDEVITLTPVGDEALAGSIQMPVPSDPHSMAFDHITGELFWGNADFMRVISTTDCKTHIVGDIANSRGVQKHVKALHRLDKKISISVEVPENQTKRGVAYIDSEGKQSKSIIAGQKITITAKANAGYHFAGWTKGEATEPISTEAVYAFTPSSGGTYLANFAEGDGIEEIIIESYGDVQKLIIDGQIYIVRDGRIYTITGAMVK